MSGRTALTRSRRGCRRWTGPAASSQEAPTGSSCADGSLTEAVFPVDCGVEAVPGLWTTGAAEGFVLLAAQELDHTLEPGDVVAEVRSGLVETAACDCGAVETNFLSVGEEGRRQGSRVFRWLLLLRVFRADRGEKLPGVQLVLQDSRTAERLRSRRSFQRPGRCVRPLFGRLIRAPSGGPSCGHLPGEYPQGGLVVGCAWGRSLCLGASS